MIQRRKRRDAVGQQFVDKAVVEIKAFGIRRTRAFREDARPSNRESIGLCAQRLHQLDVFLVQAIMVGRGIPIAVIGYGPGRVRETVPDRWAAAIFVHGSLDLIGRGRRAPQKIVRKTGRGCSTSCSAVRVRLGQSGPGRQHRHAKGRPACNPAKLAPGKSLEWHHFTRRAGINFEQNKAHS